MSNDRDDRPIRTSRREILIGAAAVALTAAARPVLALKKKPTAKLAPGSTTSAPQRFMAASAPLLDGRILVTGGYDKAWTGGTANPLQSAMIYDPTTGKWSVAAPMKNARARHAAVSLGDGRVAVLGGIGMNPLASVEIYDPYRNAWETSAPLMSARYDHSATAVGGAIHVIGGNAGLSAGGAEAYRATAGAQLPRE